MPSFTSHSPQLRDTDAAGQHALVRTLLWIFQLPGNLAADRLGAKSEDDRMMIRMLIGILVWNLAIVIVAWFVFSYFG